MESHLILRVIGTKVAFGVEFVQPWGDRLTEIVAIGQSSSRLRCKGIKKKNWQSRPTQSNRKGRNNRMLYDYRE
jgi:hypothetical protein